MGSVGSQSFPFPCTSLVDTQLRAVVVAPSAFVRGLEDVELNDLGLEAVFECEVSKSDLKAEWFKGDKPLKRSEKHNITSKNGKHSLTISDCQVDDVDSYTIKLDGISSTAKLAIKGTSQFPNFVPKHFSATAVRCS